MALTPGTRLGPYEIVSTLGAGGMGAVYRARDSKLNRDVALKVLLPEVADDPERLARFRREAQTLAALNHPNIAHIHGLEDGQVGQDGRVGPFLVMELVEGEDLSDRIALGAIPLDEALPIARQITDALEAAHEQGIIHRDLKPVNIKVRADGTVKVLDFGLAKAMEQGSGRPGGAVGLYQHDPPGSPALPDRPDLTAPTITSPAQMTGVGVILGTAAYMSPEQARGKAVDKRADVWAFGCVLYEMLSGTRAFKGGDVSDTLAAVLRAEPNWEALPPDTPQRVRTLLRRCLSKDRAGRLADVADARFDLMRDEPSPIALDTPGRGRLTPLLVASVTVAVAVGASAGALFWRSGTPTPRPVRFLVLPPENGGFVASALHQAVSPDGRQLAFTARVGTGPTMLWVRPLDAVTARVLPGTEGAETLFWSPDGAELGFIAQGVLKKAAVSGGTTQALAPASDTTLSKDVNTLSTTGSWSASGTIVYGPARDGRLYRIPASGGTPTAVTSLDASTAEVRHAMPQFLPDGRFLYLSLPGGDVTLGSLDGSAPRPLLQADCKALYAENHLLFVRYGTLLGQMFHLDAGEISGEPFVIANDVRCNPRNGGGGYSVSENGVLTHRAGDPGDKEQLTWVDRAGQPDGTVAEPLTGHNHGLSPSGRFVAMDETRREDNSGSLWLFDLVRGSRMRFTSGASANDTLDLLPVWSPDGASVVFASNRDRRVFQLYRKFMDRQDPEERLLTTDHNDRPTDWSPDGRFIVYNETGPTDSSDIWMLPLTGERKPSPLLQTRFNEAQGRLSPDGRWLAYTSDETGRREIYVQPFPATGARWSVSINGGTHPQWSRDGKELFYVDLERRMVSVPVRMSGAVPDIGVPRVLFATRVNRELPLSGNFYSVRADSERFLVSNVADATQSVPISVVLNWMAGLEK